MNKYQSLIVFVALITIVLFSFDTHPVAAGSVKGKIIPYNAALHAWAVSGNDTGTGLIQQGGAFEITGLKEGRYRIIIEGLRPYKTTTKTDVVVSSGSATDVGDIILDQ